MDFRCIFRKSGKLIFKPIKRTYPLGKELRDYSLFWTAFILKSESASFFDLSRFGNFLVKWRINICRVKFNYMQIWFIFEWCKVIRRSRLTLNKYLKSEAIDLLNWFFFFFFNVFVFPILLPFDYRNFNFTWPIFWHFEFLSN